MANVLRDHYCSKDASEANPISKQHFMSSIFDNYQFLNIYQPNNVLIILDYIKNIKK